MTIANEQLLANYLLADVVLHGETIEQMVFHFFPHWQHDKIKRTDSYLSGGHMFHTFKTDLTIYVPELRLLIQPGTTFTFKFTRVAMMKEMHATALIVGNRHYE